MALAWTASAGATSYSIYRGTASGGEGTTPVGTSTSNSFTDTGLTNGTTYYYKVSREQQRRHVGAVQRGERDADDVGAAAVEPADQRRRSGDRDLGGR